MPKAKNQPAPTLSRRLGGLLRSRRALIVAAAAALAVVLFTLTEYESYASLYDAEYVTSAKCGECHKIIYEQWQRSPHANMARLASVASVVGDFDDGSYMVPAEYATPDDVALPAARMTRQGNSYFMSLRNPGTDQYTPFRVDYVIGYQYRQTYLTRENGGVLRRLPLQWSTERQEFFPYWNYQEQSPISVEDLWAQMTTLNSAWNLFCARCHTTNLEVIDKNPQHTFAVTEWTDAGIGCEACHGPGSQHVNYFEHNYVNRFAAFLNSTVRGEPVAYVANAPKMSKGQDLSVCARCHGADILLSDTDVYRIYEPGYSREGRINDLSPYFKTVPLSPRDFPPTVEIYADGQPKGLGTLFRSFIESTCYEQAEVRCYDCHKPHDNKEAARPGILEASETSNQYCLACHTGLADQIAEHSNHEAGTEGSFCMDCHMPRNLVNIVSGTQRRTRTHEMSSLPNPPASEQFGVADAPNACNNCHSDQTPAWATEWYNTWWGPAQP